MHHLGELIEIWKKKAIWLNGDLQTSYDLISCDSRNLDPSKKWVFFARRGSVHDGHQFINEVLKLPQVVAVVAERAPHPDPLIIQVRDSKLAMALAAKAFYGDPSKNLECVAVTGTNGKTTTAFLLQHFLEAQNKPAAISGTVRTGFGEDNRDSLLTTPDFSVLQSFLQEVKAKAAKAFVFEASSHALDQGRLLGLELDAALFTNLSQEHLDYHGSMDSYFQAKRRLFTEILKESAKNKKLAVLPHDGAYGSRLLEEILLFPEIETVSWGFEAKSPASRHLHIRSWKTDLQGSLLELSWMGSNFNLHSPLVGKFNIENLAGVLTFALASGTEPGELSSILENFNGVPGRLERITVRNGAKVFVDYAHTPDALENILSTLRPLCVGNLVVVFGCGGDRDRSKRPAMAQVVELYADRLILTSDNPRSESPGKIIEEMMTGLQRVKPVEVEIDRRKAIERAAKDLRPQDVLVVAGKGHEKYQQIGNQRLEFDDVRVVREFLG